MNTVTLLGRVVKDPDVKDLGSDILLAEFILAVPRPKKKDEADFIRIKGYNKVADNMFKYLKGGRQVCIRGQLRIDRVKDIYYTSVTAQEMTFIYEKK